MRRSVAWLAAATALAAAAPASGAGLPAVSTGHRPGPDALYGPEAEAPQLQNTHGWKAEPILVSGAAAYRDGEWLYQDFLFDDHGAAGVLDPNTPYGAGAHLYSTTAGTFTYPTDPVYAHNAADLVELRVRPAKDATLFRVTLNTLKDPARSAFTIALGDGESAAWPHGAGVSSPAQFFVTVHGSTADLLKADGSKAAAQPTATVDAARTQIEVSVPHAGWDPGTGKVRTTIGTGLWDAEANQYLAPSPDSATETTPGGGVPQGVAIVNAGPRFEEPWPDVDNPTGTWTMADSAAGGIYQAAWWRDRAQADALRLGDVSPFHAEIDFSKLAAKADDDYAVPKTGMMNRILASRYVFGQGLDPSRVCFEIGGVDEGAGCIGRQIGQLQNYSLYVPKKPQPEKGYGMTLLLHSLSANYNQYSNSKNQSQLGEREGGSLVITPAGRGPDGFYSGIAEADTFEVWADVARRYKLDPDWTVVSGYSMGGFGTYRLLARWPDLFARGFSVVGIPGSVNDQLPSLRNTPILAWNSDADELVNISDSEQAVADLTAAGLRFVENLHLAADHLTLATNDEYGPGAAWLGAHRVDRNPMHVTFVVDPSEDSLAADSIADHAYWVSDLKVRDPAKGTGTIDAKSAAFGVGDPPVEPVKQAGGTLDGGSHGPMPYFQREQAWGKAPAAPKADKLVVDAKNVSVATIDVARAELSCAPQIELKTDGPLDLRIACARAVRGARCGAVEVALPRVKGDRVVRADARSGKKQLGRARGRDLRSVSVKRASSRAFSVRISMRTAKGRRISTTRRIAAC